MATIKIGTTVVVGNPDSSSFAYRGTVGKVVIKKGEIFTIKSDNGNYSSWKERELLYLHD